MIETLSQPRPGGFLFDGDYPRPAKPYDKQPAGPPKRICPVCGLKYIQETDKDSPCGHVKKDGTLTLDRFP